MATRAWQLNAWQQGAWLGTAWYVDTATVPNVVGMTQANAIVAIDAVPDLTSTVFTEHHPSVPVGNVIRQEPAASTVVEFDDDVAIFVSLGPATDVGIWREVTSGQMWRPIDGIN